MRILSFSVFAIIGVFGASLLFLPSSEKWAARPEESEKLPKNDNLTTALTNALSNKGSETGFSEGTREYFHKKRGFSFTHSPQAVIQEYNEGGNATTLVLEERDSKRGFQVFIMPYGEMSVSDERFRLDVPSGVRENETEILLGKDQIRAAAFNSLDAFLGETFEVWFIHEGYLYEITTLKNTSDWITPILNSWKFANS